LLSLDITPLLCTTVIDCAVSFQLFDKNNLYFRCIFVKLLTHELNSFDFKGRLEVLSLFWFCLVGHTCSSKFKNVGLKKFRFLSCKRAYFMIFVWTETIQKDNMFIKINIKKYLKNKNFFLLCLEEVLPRTRLHRCSECTRAATLLLSPEAKMRLDRK
jgi:hypothetical protein